MNVGAFVAKFAVALLEVQNTKISTSCRDKRLVLSFFSLLIEKVDPGTHLCEVFADVVCGAGQVMAERACLASLARTLPEEFARNVRGICRHSQLRQYGRTHLTMASVTSALAHRLGTYFVSRVDSAALRIAELPPWREPSSATARCSHRSEDRVR